MREGEVFRVGRIKLHRALELFRGLLANKRRAGEPDGAPRGCPVSIANIKTAPVSFP